MIAVAPGTVRPRSHTRENYHQLSIETARPIRYSVYNVASGTAFTDSCPLIPELLHGRNVVLVVDARVKALYDERLLPYFSSNTSLIAVATVSGREADKTLDALERLCASLAEAGLDRNGVIVAVGGGVVLDIAGAAASLFRRGVRYVRIPTTLVGAIDVACGIKQAVNFGSGKNLLGAFYPPLAGIVDAAFFKTLDARDVACGVAEMLKMGLVCEPVLFELLERHARALIESRFQSPADVAFEAIARAQGSMMRELQANLFEEDLRRLVDFGHTFSPAMEAASGYRLPHGEAVAIDMMLSTRLAVLRGLCNDATLQRLNAVYADAALPVTHETATPETLERGLQSALKHRAGNLNLVVPTGIGSATFVQEVGDDEVRSILSWRS